MDDDWRAAWEREREARLSGMRHAVVAVVVAVVAVARAEAAES